MPIDEEEDAKPLTTKDIKIDELNENLYRIFDNDIKSWPLYFTPNILPSTNKKVFYIGDAFNGFLPTLAQGAGQSIESAYEIFRLLKEDHLAQIGRLFELSDKNEQIKCFLEHIYASQKINLPIIVHTRFAEEETLKILKDEKKNKYGN